MRVKMTRPTMVDRRVWRLPNADSVCIFLARGSYKGGFCVRSDLTSSVRLGAGLSLHFSSFPSLPLYLQPPSLPVPHVPLENPGVSLTRPKHTGKVLKKARLRCAFAISSTLLSPHFFSSFPLLNLYLTTCITTSLSSWPPSAKPI